MIRNFVQRATNGSSRLALAALASSVVVCFSSNVGACEPDSSWAFRSATYSHDPSTGSRVNQYAREPWVAALPDTSAISSGYRQTRVSQYGADGSVTNYYRVDNWGNGRGGLDAQWERVNDVWQNSVQSGGNFRYNNYGGYGYGPVNVPRFGNSGVNPQ